MTTEKKNYDKKDMKSKINLFEFAGQLKRFRIEENQKQSDIAEKCGFTRTYINELEASKWLPSFNFLTSLTEVFKNLKIKIFIENGKIDIIFNKEKS